MCLRRKEGKIAIQSAREKRRGSLTGEKRKRRDVFFPGNPWAGEKGEALIE